MVRIIIILSLTLWFFENSLVHGLTVDQNNKIETLSNALENERKINKHLKQQIGIIESLEKGLREEREQKDEIEKEIIAVKNKIVDELESLKISQQSNPSLHDVSIATKIAVLRTIASKNGK